VALAVYCELVSILNSLFIREFTGNFVVSAAEIEKVTAINASFRVDTKRIPYSTQQGTLLAYQGIIRRDQGALYCFANSTIDDSFL